MEYADCAFFRSYGIVILVIFQNIYGALEESIKLE